MEINQALEKLDSFESTKSGPKQSKSGSDKQNVTVKRDPLRNFTPSK